MAESPAEQAARQAAWNDIRSSLRSAMPEIDDEDVVLIARLLVKQIWNDGPSIDELRAEHLSRPGPHDETCGVCGFVDAALYSQRTGRYLSADMTKAGRHG